MTYSIEIINGFNCLCENGKEILRDEKCVDVYGYPEYIFNTNFAAMSEEAYVRFTAIYRLLQSFCCEKPKCIKTFFDNNTPIKLHRQKACVFVTQETITVSCPFCKNSLKIKLIW